MRLPPSQAPETFFVSPDEKNDLLSARTKMLENMARYDAWKGYNAVATSAFPHYDARPNRASFPQSAETYLRATDERGRFAQLEASLVPAELHFLQPLACLSRHHGSLPRTGLTRISHQRCRPLRRRGREGGGLGGGGVDALVRGA